MDIFDAAVSRAVGSLEQVAQLNARYRAGEVHVSVPEGLRDSERSIEKLGRRAPAGLACGARSGVTQLFFSLPVAFNPAESVGRISR
jgi:hypothetical protein